MNTAVSLPRPWIVADIGGTNARFGWLAEGADHPEHVATLPGAKYRGPAEAAQAYLQQVAQTLGPAYAPPRAAAFAVAAAVGGDRVELINAHGGWKFSRLEVQQALGLQALLLLNDFEALALSLPRLRGPQLQRWPGAPAGAATDFARAVVGPGTGLGVAGLVRAREGWVAVPGEGGHASVACGDAFEAEVLAAAQRQFSHVSAERFLSGIGLPVLHAAVCTVMGQPAGELQAQQIVDGALAGGQPLCERTLDTFCALLGGFAGNVVLTMGARGGLYIGGGIVPRLGERFFRSRFRERFVAKGRLQPYLEAVPIALITDTLAALSGGVQALEQHVL